MAIQELAKRVEYTLLPVVGTWVLATRAPHKAKLLTEADFNLLADARANRVGLLEDRCLDDPAPREGATDQVEAWKIREYRSPKSSWEWFSSTIAHALGAALRSTPWLTALAYTGVRAGRETGTDGKPDGTR